MPTLVRAERDERDALLAFLETQRDAVHRAGHGLTDEQAAATPGAGALSVAGLVKHLTRVEVYWAQVVLGGLPDPDPHFRDHWDDYFRPLPGETLAALLAGYRAVARRTEEIVRALPGLAATVPLPDAAWYPPGTRRSARWILLHLIQETARHAGHADIVRESLDGATAPQLAAAAEEGARQQGAE